MPEQYSKEERGVEVTIFDGMTTHTERCILNLVFDVDNGG